MKITALIFLLGCGGSTPSQMTAIAIADGAIDVDAGETSIDLARGIDLASADDLARSPDLAHGSCQVPASICDHDSACCSGGVGACQLGVSGFMFCCLPATHECVVGDLNYKCCPGSSCHAVQGTGGTGLCQ